MKFIINFSPSLSLCLPRLLYQFGTIETKINLFGDEISIPTIDRSQLAFHSIAIVWHKLIKKDIYAEKESDERNIAEN